MFAHNLKSFTIACALAFLIPFTTYHISILVAPSPTASKENSAFSYYQKNIKHKEEELDYLRNSWSTSASAEVAQEHAQRKEQLASELDALKEEQQKLDKPSKNMLFFISILVTIISILSAFFVSHQGLSGGLLLGATFTFFIGSILTWKFTTVAARLVAACIVLAIIIFLTSRHNKE